MSNLLDFHYPGYLDSSYLRNEDGFNTPTPYGDSLDVLLSDVGSDILARYATAFVATPIISAVLETTLKLETYVKAGGTLIVTIDALSSLPSLLGVSVDTDNCISLPPGQAVCMSPGDGCTQATMLNESRAIKACCVTGGSLQPVLHTATANSTTLVWSTVSAYKGKLLVLATSGMSAARVTPPDANSRSGTRFPNPFPMADHARSLLARLLEDKVPFSTGTSALTMVVNRVDTAEYLVAISNSKLSPQPFNLTSRLGSIKSIAEIPLLDAALGVNDTQGYAPTGFEHSPRGVSGNSTIAGLDQRIFKVSLNEEAATILLTVAPAVNPYRVALPLPETTDIRTDIMLRPTFGQHFDGIVL